MHIIIVLNFFTLYKKPFVKCLIRDICTKPSLIYHMISNQSFHKMF